MAYTNISPLSAGHRTLERQVNNSTWDDLHDYSTGTVLSSSHVLPRIYTWTVSDKWYSIARGFLIFDCSGIESGECTRSELILRCASKSNGLTDSFDLKLLEATLINPDSIDGDDYSCAAPSLYATLNYDDILTGGSTTTLSLNSTAVSKINLAGYLDIIFKVDTDYTDTPPTWSSLVGNLVDFDAFTLKVYTYSKAIVAMDATTNIGDTSAKVHCHVTDLGEYSDCQVRFAYRVAGSEEEPTYTDWQEGITNEASETITGLSVITEYEVYAEALNAKGSYPYPTVYPDYFTTIGWIPKVLFI